MKHLFIILVFLLLAVPKSYATIEVYEFETDQQERLFQSLVKELRCPKCQNQTIAESNAPLAKDMREKTYEMVTQGKDADEVVDYMVARFGNFVRYDPPMNPATIFLWLGPILFIFFSALVIFLQARKRKAELNPEETEKLKQLLAEEEKILADEAAKEEKKS